MRLRPPRPQGTRRRSTQGRRALVAGLASGAFHLALLVALVTAARPPAPPTEPRSVVVELMAPPAPAQIPVVARAAPPATPARAAVPAVHPARATPPPGVAAPPAIAAPSAFAVGGPGSAADQKAQTRDAARAGIGCAHVDFLKLTKAERAACADAVGLKALTAPLYAVIDPDKKAAFDGDCKKDDDWCLYRTGKGPYPGLFALGKKRKKDPYTGW